MNRLITCAVALAAAVVLGACAGGKPKTSPIVTNGAPDWVNRGNGAFKEQGKPVFYGVGILQGVRNVGLAIPTVDDRGRVEIAKVMDAYVTALGKDYAASVTAGDPSKTSEEQMVSQTHKVFTQFQLHGSMPVDHWVDRSDPTAPVYYSLVKLDMSAVQAAVAESKDLDSKVRDFVKANAEKAFDELSAEQAKH